MSNLWYQNTPQNFWLLNPAISNQYWQEALRKSIHLLGLTGDIEMDELSALTLGEGRFGTDHWELSWAKRVYYLLKPILPRTLTRSLRQYYSSPSDTKPRNNWPIDSRYVSFQWELMRQLLVSSGNSSIQYKSIWPNKHQFALGSWAIHNWCSLMNHS